MADPDAAGRIRAVVFDLGGVLLDWNPRYLYRKLFDGDDAAMERFLAEVCTMEWHHAHDLGVPPERTSPPLVQAHPEHEHQIWAWSQRSEEMIAGPIDGTVEILSELKAAGVPCYALTNMERETYPLRRERFEFLKWFDGTVVSGFEGVAKPDVAVFELLLDRFELDPATTAFVDDSAANVRAAEKAGIQAVEFSSPDQLRRWLRRAGLLAGVTPLAPSSQTADPCRSTGRRSASSDSA
ncbi:MAG TPA: HAD family phosphatase [Solirubrobacteraceae bacterium]|nr:HAD family phosphatase [Solirubrobacteraceae bacterium]